MASTYKDREQNAAVSNSGSDLSKSIGKTVSGNNTALSNSAATPSTASGYAKQLTSLAKDKSLQYQPGDSVTSAQQYLDSVIAQKPGSYQSKYTSQLESLYDQIMNRGNFSYDMNADAMYQTYADRYRQLGMRNMNDVYGQESARTGGYGSSYAQTAGQSAYNDAMGQLAQQGAQLQSQAIDRYNDETTRMKGLYDTARQAESTDYQRYADAYSRWQNERGYAAGRYDTAYGQDYQKYQTGMDAAMTITDMQREDDRTAMKDAQDQAMTYIKAGIMPSAKLLKSTGWNTDDVAKLVKKYK